MEKGKSILDQNLDPYRHTYPVLALSTLSVCFLCNAIIFSVILNSPELEPGAPNFLDRVVEREVTEGVGSVDGSGENLDVVVVIVDDMISGGRVGEGGLARCVAW